MIVTPTWHNGIATITLEYRWFYAILLVEVFNMSTTIARPSALALVPGPVWSSFEKLRKGGNSTLEEISEHGVGTLVGKGVTYRILRDADFQHLVGLATDVHRLQQGRNFRR